MGWIKTEVGLTNENMNKLGIGSNMSSNVQFIAKSKNAKTGPIPTTNSSAVTCPDSCALKDAGCYASAGFHTRLNWNKVTSGERGGSWTELCSSVASLPVGQIWRHNVSGDLPHKNQRINQKALTSLVRANKGKRGFTYTHHDTSKLANRQAITKANANGFTVNLSADNPSMADRLKKLAIAPVVTVLPEDTRDNFTTAAGHKVVICPAITHDNVTCQSCKLCSLPDRDTIIGFPAHGTGKGKITF